MIGLTRPRWKKIKGIYCSLIGSYGFIQSLSQTKSNNQQNNEGSRMRVIFEKGTPSAHINKNMHLECLSQNTVKTSNFSAGNQLRWRAMFTYQKPGPFSKWVLILCHTYVLMSYLNLPNCQIIWLIDCITNIWKSKCRNNSHNPFLLPLRCLLGFCWFSPVEQSYYIEQRPKEYNMFPLRFI